MYKVDLNSDIGESFGVYELGMDREIIPYITSANVACGWHGGDPIVMGKTVEMAVKDPALSDRAYNCDGSLVARNIPGAIIHNADLI